MPIREEISTPSSSFYFEGFKADQDLIQKTVRSGVVTVISQVLGVGIQFASIVVLSRLLTPRDFGIVAMVVFFSQPLQNLGENGFLEAIVQSDTLDHGKLSALFWINVGVCTLLTVLFVCSAPLLAGLYGEPDLAAVVAVLASGILLASLGSQHLALLRRTMQFGRINSYTLANRLLSVIVSIGAAYLGWGYWAIIAGMLLLVALNSGSYWYLCTWRPGFPASAGGIRPMVMFTVHTLGRFYINYFGRNVDNLMVGGALGPIALGIYKKAYDLFALSSNLLAAPLTSVALSGLSRIRHDAERFRRSYLTAAALLMFFGAGVSGLMTLVGEKALVLLLGSQWSESGRIFTYFAPGIGLLLLYSTTSWLHLSLGTVNLWFRWSIVEMIVSIALFYLGLQFGPAGVAIAWVTSMMLLLGPGVSYAGKSIGLTFGSVAKASVPYVLAALVATVSLGTLLKHAVTHSWLSSLGDFYYIIVVALAYSATFLLMVFLVPATQGFEPIMGFWRALKRRSS